MFRRATLVLAVSAALFTTIFVIYQYEELNQPGIIVLLYHKVTDSTENSDKYTIDGKEFEAQIAYLRNHGYSTILPSEIIGKNIHINPPKTIMLTFDDGTEDHYYNVLRVLTKNNMKAVFCIVSRYIGSPGSLTQDEIKEMSRDDMEICSHTVTHPFLDELDVKGVAFQLRKSKADLELISGEKVNCLAPPGGWFNAEVVKEARETGYQILFTCEIGTNDLRYHPFVFKRIEVLGGMNLTQFEQLLAPHRILYYKLTQSLKFFLHDVVGSSSYHYLARHL